MLIPQVSQLEAVAQKYQACTQNAAPNLSIPELQNNCNLFVASARQLAKALEVPLVNDLGYTKRYVRCLQISKVDFHPDCLKEPLYLTTEDVLKYEQAYKDGYTVAQRGMEFRYPGIAAIADTLALMFGQPSVDANLYLTPPNSQAGHMQDNEPLMRALSKLIYLNNLHTEILLGTWVPALNIFESSLRRRNCAEAR
ncbi:hypothetical protein KIW84_056414 [Lathyrus oleraceus]|uniref:Uncharacterized protein n=1 Tax=Pisum sativum TaxID=3888 RepID=A0A9D5AMK3_PEA|nr:hypothetical protein KIW84_056414 [Pisum sativum]